MIQVLPPKYNFGSQLGQTIGQGLQGGFQQSFQQQQQLGLQQQQQQRQQSLLNTALTEADKVYQDQNLTTEQKQIGVYKALSRFPDIAQKVTGSINSNLKAANKAQPGGVTAQPVPPEIAKKIRDIREKNPNATASELELEFNDAGIPPVYSGRNIETKRREDESKATKTDKSYEAQKDFIDKTTNQYRGWETETKPRLQQMQSMNPEDLISPTAATFLEAMGIPLGALEDPSSQVYQKLSQDLLKGLPETYGNRILKVEVDNFLKTIPTLLNSPDGRRMIASNMLKLGEMKEIYYKEMRRQQKEALESDKPLAKDFEQNVFDNVLPQINKINNEFVQLSSVKSVPPGTIPFFNPQGTISFVPNEFADQATKEGGRRIW